MEGTGAAVEGCGCGRVRLWKGAAVEGSEVVSWSQRALGKVAMQPRADLRDTWRGSILGRGVIDVAPQNPFPQQETRTRVFADKSMGRAGFEALESCGHIRLWRAVEGCGGLWSAVERCGALWKIRGPRETPLSMVVR